MSDDILNNIETTMYEIDCRYRDEFPGKPKFSVKFSPEGHARCRAEKMAHLLFSDHLLKDSTFMGWPFEIVGDQAELFEIKVEGL